MRQPVTQSARSCRRSQKGQSKPIGRRVPRACGLSRSSTIRHARRSSCRRSAPKRASRMDRRWPVVWRTSRQEVSAVGASVLATAFRCNPIQSPLVRDTSETESSPRNARRRPGHGQRAATPSSTCIAGCLECADHCAADRCPGRTAVVRRTQAETHSG